MAEYADANWLNQIEADLIRCRNYIAPMDHEDEKLDYCKTLIHKLLCEFVQYQKECRKTDDYAQLYEDEFGPCVLCERPTPETYLICDKCRATVKDRALLIIENQ